MLLLLTDILLVQLFSAVNDSYCLAVSAPSKKKI